ncbi:pentapeptide repeat-containing protein [Streptomyces javensis]|uniref:pentapeptide repeat-containing protein n=1 Tax=Streptomyces javensis TaxID=114698 RepID=UPI0033D91859
MSRLASENPSYFREDAVRTFEAFLRNRAEQSKRNPGFFGHSNSSARTADIRECVAALLHNVTPGAHINIDLQHETIPNLDLRAANAAGANMSGTRLINPKLAGAILSNADLSGATLSGDVAGADFSSSAMEGADFLGVQNAGKARFQYASCDRWTELPWRLKCQPQRGGEAHGNEDRWPPLRVVRRQPLGSAAGQSAVAD